MSADVPRPWRSRALWLAALKALIVGVPVFALYAVGASRLLVHVCSRSSPTLCDVAYIGYVVCAIVIGRIIFVIFRPKRERHGATQAP